MLAFAVEMIISPSPKLGQCSLLMGSVLLMLALGTLRGCGPVISFYPFSAESL